MHRVKLKKTRTKLNKRARYFMMILSHGTKFWMVVALLTGSNAPAVQGRRLGQEKLDVCHVTNVPNEGDGVVISIADPAWETHEKHGDIDIMMGTGVVDNGDGTCHIQTCAIDDEVTTPVDTPVTIDVLANDDCYSTQGVVVVQEFPQYGDLGIVDVGVFEYTPYAGISGTDGFTYEIDDTGNSDTATVTIIVGP